MDKSRLNKAQREAVESTEGRVLILAGAGSGKTSVLTSRIGHLIRLGVPPDAILGLTFTNKAAEEMRVRLSGNIEPRLARRVLLSTFHSFCMYVLRREAEWLGYTDEFSLYDRQDIVRLMNSIAKDVLEHEGAIPSVAKTLDVICLAKNKGVKPEGISGSGSTWHDGFAREVAKRLNESLRAYNAMDFDHLLWLTAELFEKFPDVLATYQDRFRYVMIDEYQDTNPIQAKIAELLTKKSKNLCVVGDDDQSIYSWRGADVANILRFEEAKVVKLEQNFRSTNTILKAANAVIDCNTKRHKKALWSDKGEGVPIEVFYAPNEVCEAEAVIKRLLKLKEKQGLRWGDFAILYRSNALCRLIESGLLRQSILDEGNRYRGIPYQVYGGDEFYEHKEVKDLLAYLRVISNPQDHEALLRVINYPRRGIGEVALDAMTQMHRKQGVALWKILEGVADGTMEEFQVVVSDRARGGVKRFCEIIKGAKERFHAGALSSGLAELVEKLEFQKALFEEVKSDQMRKRKLENVAELISSLKEYEESSLKGEEVIEPSLRDFLSTTQLDADSNNFKARSKDSADHVHLMTFHSAKGLEFKACFLIGLEDHLLPHEKSTKDGNIEEERRLLYVALTRAKEFLTLSMASARKRMGQDAQSKPSRFLFEIPKELLQVTRWDS
jgi:DNA helicase II / ATP-dependent DNA helicase PcrA